MLNNHLLRKIHGSPANSCSIIKILSLALANRHDSKEEMTGFEDRRKAWTFLVQSSHTFRKRSYFSNIVLTGGVLVSCFHV